MSVNLFLSCRLYVEINEENFNCCLKLSHFMIGCLYIWFLLSEILVCTSVNVLVGRTIISLLYQK